MVLRWHPGIRVHPCRPTSLTRLTRLTHLAVLPSEAVLGGEALLEASPVGVQRAEHDLGTPLMEWQLVTAPSYPPLLLAPFPLPLEQPHTQKVQVPVLGPVEVLPLEVAPEGVALSGSGVVDQGH